MTHTVSRTHDTLAHVLDATGRRVSRHDVISNAYAEAERLNKQETTMSVDTSETLAQRAERTALAMDKFGFPTTAATLRALAAERDAAVEAAVQAERRACLQHAVDAIPTANPPRTDGYGNHVAGERYAAEHIASRIRARGPADALAAALAKAREDALREEWREIAAGLTTDEPEIGELWPMVSEVSGSLTAVRQYFKNEITEHNTTKAQRDAATSALAKAEGEAARYRYLRDHCSSHYPMTQEQPAEWSIQWEFQQRTPAERYGSLDGLIDNDIARQAELDRADAEDEIAALTPAPEAPNAAVREAGSALWTEDHRQKMAQEASAILDEMRQGAPKDGE